MMNDWTSDCANALPAGLRRCCRQALELEIYEVHALFFDIKNFNLLAIPKIEIKNIVCFSPY